MFAKAFKTIAPYLAGTLAGLAVVALVWGLDAAVKAIIPVAVGTLAAFAAAVVLGRKKKK